MYLFRFVVYVVGTIIISGNIELYFFINVPILVNKIITNLLYFIQIKLEFFINMVFIHIRHILSFILVFKMVIKCNILYLYFVFF